MFSNMFGDGRMGTILAVVIGICLVGLIVIYAWRTFGRGTRPAVSRGARPSRLGIVDVFDVDRYRQLVIVRRDNVEHLILIGGPNDLLIEDAIVRAQPVSSERRDPLPAAPGPVEQRPQMPRVSFDPFAAPSPAGQGPAPAIDMKSAQEATTSVAVTPPSLRPKLDQAFAEAIAPPPPLGRPASVSPSRTMPQAAVPQPTQPTQPARQSPLPARPAPGPPRPGAPTLAQRPINAPAVTPPAPPALPAMPVEPERMPEPGKQPAVELAQEAPKLTLNIDSLEEEMAKLLGRPVEPPRP